MCLMARSRVEQPVELVVADAQRIAARQQHVAHFGMRLEIGERLFPLPGRELVFAARIADEARARAVAAIGRAGAGRQEQHAVGIAMDEARHDRVVVFAQRIVGLARHAHIFVARHDVRAAQRLGRIVEAHQARVIGRDADRQRAFVAPDGARFVVGQAEDARQIVQRADAGAELPVPVVPFGRRGAGIEAAIEGLRLGADGKAQDRLALPGAADPGKRESALSMACRNDRLGAVGPRRRLELAPPQQLETHRRLVTLRGPRRESPNGFPSNGRTSRRIFRRLGRFVKRNRTNTGIRATGPPIKRVK